MNNATTPRQILQTLNDRLTSATMSHSNDELLAMELELVTDWRESHFGNNEYARAAYRTLRNLAFALAWRTDEIEKLEEQLEIYMALV